MELNTASDPEEPLRQLAWYPALNALVGEYAGNRLKGSKGLCQVVETRPSLLVIPGNQAVSSAT